MYIYSPVQNFFKKRNNTEKKEISFEDFLIYAVSIINVVYIHEDTMYMPWEAGHVGFFT